MSGLKIAPGLELPPEAMLQRVGILAMSGAGKSNAAVVMAEEMYDASIPWVAVDPKGDWWGVRSSRSGKGAGLEVPVFGGLHGDVPLEESGGKLMAEVIADDRLTCVLDISEMTKGAQLRFLTDFAEVLLRRNRAPLQVIAEEADEYLPQRVMKREAQCVGAWSKLVKRGRFRGVFVTLVSQRSAALNKDALSQIDTLIPMRVGDPRDKKALREWVVEHDVGQEMFDSLPSLDDGEAWVWSPHKLKLMERIRFRRRRTFDSGATPDWEEQTAARLADVDLGAIEEKMAATIERARAEDPRALNARIRDLQRQLAAAERAPREVEVERTVEVPVEVPALADGEVERLEAAATAAREAADALRSAGHDVEQRLVQVALARRGKHTLPDPEPRRREERPGRPRADAAAAPARTPAVPPAADNGGEVRIKAGARRMLGALAQLHPEPLTRRQLATLAGVSPGGTFSSYLSALTRAGLVAEDGGGILLTGAGQEQEAGNLGAGAPPPEELAAMYAAKLKLGARRMLGVLMAERDGMSREELARAAGVTPGGTFSSYLSSLRRNGLAEESGGLVRPGEALFLGVG